MHDELTQPFGGQAELDQMIEQQRHEREANGPVKCDVPDCPKRWRGIRKLGWESPLGAPLHIVTYFLCNRHMKVSHTKLRKLAPTGLPEFDNARDAPDPANQ